MLPAATAVPDTDAQSNLRRVALRQWLVPDVSATVEILNKNLGWKAGPVQEGGNLRCTDLEVSRAKGATIRLVEPVGPGPAMEHLRDWGSGPYYCTVLVANLEEQVDKLRRQGVRHSQATGEGGEPVLRVLPGEIPQTLIEFVEGE
jgi:hypothetical protein